MERCSEIISKIVVAEIQSKGNIKICKQLNISVLSDVIVKMILKKKLVKVSNVSMKKCSYGKTVIF